jgi:nitrite reductase/ring-hydroxylating ferredoxin subunit
VRTNPARPLPGAIIAEADAAPEGGAVAIDFSAGEMRFSLLLVRKNGALYAYENLCPHAHYPLERPDGRVVVQQGRYIVCTAHGASFDAETGACVGGPCIGEKLTPLPIRVENGVVFMS